MKNQEKLLTIGQFAKLHKINKKTLMWYDEIDLFHPAHIDPDNGYRYYSYYQSAILETILLLRELDIPLGEIRQFMKNRSASTMHQVVQEQMKEIDRRIADLNAIRNALQMHEQALQTIAALDLSALSVIKKEKQPLITVAIDQDTPFHTQVEMITAQTANSPIRHLHEARYGTMIAIEHLKNKDFSKYTQLFIEIPASDHEKEMHIQPAGTYIRAYYKDASRPAERCYERIFDFASQNGLELSGYAYEIILNDNVIDRLEDAIVQVEIRAEKNRGTLLRSRKKKQES